MLPRDRQPVPNASIILVEPEATSVQLALQSASWQGFHGLISNSNCKGKGKPGPGPPDPHTGYNFLTILCRA